MPETCKALTSFGRIRHGGTSGLIRLLGAKDIGSLTAGTSSLRIVSSVKARLPQSRRFHESFPFTDTHASSATPN